MEGVYIKYDLSSNSFIYIGAAINGVRAVAFGTTENVLFYSEEKAKELLSDYTKVQWSLN